MPTLLATSIGTFLSMGRSIVLTSMQRTPDVLSRTQGATSNYKNLDDEVCEPAGHGIGRSHGGLTSKIHHAVDGRGRPLAVVVTGGQRHDGVILPQVLADIRAPRAGGGRPRTWPDAILADRAYGSKTNRAYLPSRRIRAVIPEKKDQIAARESIGPDIARSGVVTTTFLEGKVVSSLTLAESIQAAHVSSNEAFPFGVTSELCSMETYHVPRQWAHGLHDSGFDGIWYHPRFSPGAGARAIAVFGPAGVASGEIYEQKDLRAVIEDMTILIVDPDSLEEFEILDEPPET